MKGSRRLTQSVAEHSSNSSFGSPKYPFVFHSYILSSAHTNLYCSTKCNIRANQLFGLLFDEYQIILSHLNLVPRVCVCLLDMPKSRRKKVPVTSPNSISSHGAAPGKPRSTHTAAIIRRFHTLLKEETKHRDAGDLAALHAVQDEMEKLGGLEAYQQMSAVGQGDDRGGGTEKVFIGWLKDLGVHKRPDVLQYAFLFVLVGIRHVNVQ